MRNHKAFLFAAIVLMTSSIAGADLILTLNGYDVTDFPLLQVIGEFLVAVEGSTEIGPNDVSVGAVGGVLEPVADANNEYYFEFDADSNEGTISLVTTIAMVIDGNSIPAGTTIYQLLIFCNREENIFAASGIGLAELISFEIVSDVVGMTQSAAVSAITSAGLAVGTVTHDYSDTIPAGSVISQNPAGGVSVPFGSAVDLVISGVPEIVAVPELVGLPQSEAEWTIAAAGLAIGTVTHDYSDTVAAGLVISQDPVGGTAVPIGSAVSIVVSLGQPVVVPNVVGMTQAAAEGAIEAVDSLTANVSTGYSDTVAAGLVISQSPVGGTAVPIGSTVRIVVSLGQPVVPNAYLILTLNGHDVTDFPLIQSMGEFIVAVEGSTEIEPNDVSVGAVGGVLEPVADANNEYYFEFDATSNEAIISLVTTIAMVIDGNSIPAGATIYIPAGTTIYQLYLVCNREQNIFAASGYGLADLIWFEIVPDVVGMTQSAAVAAITSAGLAVGTVTHDYSDTIPAGSVISPSLVGGTAVPIGSAVSIVVSLGQPVVPHVVGMTQAAAEGAIEAVDSLTANVSRAYSDTVAAGLVISQSPVGGTAVPIGSAVSIVVSLGQPVVVPNVVGMTQAAAEGAIEAVDSLTASVSTACSDTVAAGLVISQDPVGDSVVPIGSAVSIVVSLGQPVVPNVVGMTQAAAESAITAVDSLTANVSTAYSDTVAAGLVISQGPVGGSVVPIGSTVSIVVSLGKPVVPNVVGMTQAAAEGAIEAVDSLTANVSRAYSDTVAAGLVISQSPVGGTAVPIGSAVSIVVSLGQPVVPNIVGMTQAAAEGAIEAVDSLTANVSRAYSDTVPVGDVISQDPAGGTSVAIGSTVSIAVSLGQTPAEIYVDDDAEGDLGPNDPNVSDPFENGSADHPFDMIQEAIDVSMEGLGIIVLGGVYYENIDFGGHNIALGSADPNDPNVVANTIIDGSRIDAVVTFASGETANCLLTGFTIKGGNAEFGGGIYCYYSSPTISKCVISGNWANFGGGIYGHNAGPTLTNCVLSGNWAIFYGGGVYNMDGNGIVALANCTLSGNSADNGGGIHSQNSDLLLTDSIIWGNNDHGGTDESAQIDVNNSVALVNYCCVQGWTGALNGIGNFDADPCFAELGHWDDNATPMDPNDDVWVNGDYHLKSEDGRWDPNKNDWVYDAATSPCIDAGDPNSDWTAEPWPNGKRINMGAYGGTDQASMNGNPCDFNVDGIVDFADFCDMADYWQAEGSLIEDLDYDNFIDFADLRLLSKSWLWQKAGY